MRGELHPQRLKTIPSLLTDWQTWKELHPETTVMMLERTHSDFTTNQYHNLDKFVVGVTENQDSRAWQFRRMAEHSPVNDKFSDRPVVLFFDRESGTPYLFERTVKTRTLTFARVDGKIIDEQTNSVWDPRSGTALSGELKDSQLNQLVGITSFAKSWKAFYPDSTYWTP